MNREESLKLKHRKNEDFGIAFCTEYIKQYKSIERVIKKHWPIPQRDSVLTKILPKHPKFIYRCPPTQRDKIIRSMPDPPKKMVTFLDQFFYFLFSRMRQSGFISCILCYSHDLMQKLISTSSQFFYIIHMRIII